MTNNIFNLINRVTKDKRLKHSDVRIFLCLISYNSFKKIFPSLHTISSDIGIKSISDISNGLKRLKECNYIEIHRRKHQSNIYKLNNDIAEMKPQQIKESIPYCEGEIIKTQSGNEISALELDRITDEKVNSLLKDETEKYLIESGIDKGYLFTLLKIKNSLSDYKKLLLLMFCIGKVNERNKKSKIENPKGYLRVTFTDNYYSDFHKEVFETRIIKNQTVSFRTGLHNSYN